MSDGSEPELADGYTISTLDCPCCGDTGALGVLSCIECLTPWRGGNHVHNHCERGYLFAEDDLILCGCSGTAVSCDGDATCSISDYKVLGDECKRCDQ